MWLLLLLVVTVPSFVHLLLKLFNHNKMECWPGCESHAACNLHKKGVRLVQFVVKKRGCCCNLSVTTALNVQLAMNRMCMKNSTHSHMQVVKTSSNIVIAAHDHYCCSLPQYEGLCTWCSGFPTGNMIPRSCATGIVSPVAV